jgi:hypothetical protein
MALIRLDSSTREQYVERNAVSSARLKNATTTELILNIGWKLDVDDTYANVKTVLANPEFIPFYTAIVDGPGMTNVSLDPRNIAAIVEKSATTCEVFMNDGRKLQSTVTAATAAAALGYLA